MSPAPPPAPATVKQGARLSALYQQGLANSFQEFGSDGRTLEYSLAKIKERLKRDWHPEYEPESMLPPHLLHEDTTVSERATLIQLDDITTRTPLCRKTKVICTLGPACGTAEGLESLLRSGLNIARLNFSHGDHASHLRTLEMFRCGV